MSGNNNNSSLFNLRSILEKDKLNGKNFLDLERNLRNVVISKGKEDALETPIPIATFTSTDEDKSVCKTIEDRSVVVTRLMLTTMDPSLQKHFTSINSFNII